MRGYASRGKTVLFATHYLEEARRQRRPRVDDGLRRIVADGSTTRSRLASATRAVRATLTGVGARHWPELNGMASAERHGDSVILPCSDSDRAIRALLDRHPAARDIEVTGAALEDAFLELTISFTVLIIRCRLCPAREKAPATVCRPAPQVPRGPKGALHNGGWRFSPAFSPAERDVIVGGPLCESGDIFTQSEGGFISPRRLPEAEVGQLLVIECAGGVQFRDGFELQFAAAGGGSAYP